MERHRRRTSISTSRTCRTTTATPRSTAASCRSRTICRCGPTSRRSSRSTARASTSIGSISTPTARETVASGDVDFAHWPEQMLPREVARALPADARDLLEGREVGARRRRRFHGHVPAVQGRPRSERHVQPAAQAGVNDYRFPALYGSLRWTPQAFEVWDAGAGLLRRRRRSSPIRSSRSASRRGRPRDSTRPTSGADLAAFTDFEQLAGVRFARRRDRTHPARVAARPLRRAHGGRARSRSPPPPASTLMSAVARRAGGRLATAATSGGRSRRVPLPAHLPIGGELTFRFGPDEVEFDGGRFAPSRRTSRSRARRRGAERPRIAFHVVEPRLAGKRRGARRHHDRLRIARPARWRSAAAASSTA